MNILLPNDEVLNIKRTSRKNSVGLSVSHDFNRLLVPKSYSDKKIVKFIDIELNWIESAIKTQKNVLLQSLARSYLGVFLDKTGFLKQVVLFGKVLAIEYVNYLNNKELEFNEPSQVLILNKALLSSSHLVKTRVKKWFLNEIIRYLDDKVLSYAKIVGVVNSLVSIEVKDYKTRWGSCCPDGRLQFNWRLVMMPMPVVDYVIIHELCHLIHPNHSKHFWAEVSLYCPNFKQHKQWLKQNGHEIMRF